MLTVQFPTPMVAMARHIADKWQLDVPKAMTILLDQLSSIVTKSNGDVLGPMFQTMFERLVTENKVPIDGVSPELMSKLHRSKRANSASGFTGVYRNGKNWTATARDPNGGPPITVGTYLTPARAALARYQYYAQHSIPYGEIEETLDAKEGLAPYYREQLQNVLGRAPTDAEVIAEVNQHLRELGQPEVPWEGDLPDAHFKTRAGAQLPPPKTRAKDVRIEDGVPMYTSPEIEKLLDAPERGERKTNGKVH